MPAMKREEARKISGRKIPGLIERSIEQGYGVIILQKRI
jgi:hypothetical protein